jgi:hypothetical protein
MPDQHQHLLSVSSTPQDPGTPQHNTRRTTTRLTLAAAAGVLVTALILSVGIFTLAHLPHGTALPSLRVGTYTPSVLSPSHIGDTTTLDSISCTLLSTDVAGPATQQPQPSAGHQFVRVTLQMRNSGPQPRAYSAADFHVRLSGSVTLIGPASIAMSDALGSGQLAGHTSISGTITFELPTDGEHGALLYWQPTEPSASGDAATWLLGP